MKHIPVAFLAGLVAVAAATLVAGCSPKRAAKAPEAATAQRPYDFENEGAIPPPDTSAVRPEADVEETPVIRDEVVGEDVEAPRDTTRAAPAGGPAPVAGRDGGIAIPVFRVQILATTSEKSARDARNRAENRLGLPAYVTFEDGMYKVRVGDCTTREEAQKVRTKARGAGYTDAWIVTDVLRGAAPAGGTGDD